MSKPANLRRARQRVRADSPDPVERVAALTRTARTTWLGLLSYLAFVGVTLMGVEDADFFISERQTDLPLIGVSVPTTLFFYIAPTLGAMLYIHMHLYLLKLWKALGELQSDPSQPVGEGIAPWIVSDMALAQRAGAIHAYPLRSLARWVAILSIFAAGPSVLAAFWFLSMPKQDWVLTVLACGLPLFASLLAGWESWRALCRGGAEERHMDWRTRVGWVVGLAGLSVVGFLTTEGGLNGRFMHRLQLQDVAFTKKPTDWPTREEAERTFRQQWCIAKGIPSLACGPGPVTRDSENLKHQAPNYLMHQREAWCGKVLDKEKPKFDCAAQFAKLNRAYVEDWYRERHDAVSALARFVWVIADLRNKNMLGANLSGVQMEGVDLFATHLEGANLRWARMEEANLSLARIEKADLFGARMEGTELKETQMEEADLREARMGGADLSGARMNKANLSRTRMDSHTKLQGASLREAALRDVDYSDVSISADQVNSAFGDASVILPDDVPYPDHWPDWELRSYGAHSFDTEWRKWQADPEGYTPPPKPED